MATLIGLMLATVLAVAEPIAAEPNRKAIDAFFAGPVRTLNLTIGNDGVAALRRSPREYVEGTLADAGEVHGHVAVKLKGSQGSFQSLDRKPGFTLNFDKLDGAKRFHGMKRLHLNNAAQDPTFLNELIAGEIARKAGVPAPRCAHALVTLNGRDLGLYVVRESYTRDFLAEFYDDPGGDLYDGKSADVSAKLAKQLGKPDDSADLKPLVAACAEPDDAARWRALGAVLDLDRVINYLVLENVLVHWDGYSLNRNNYLLYKDPGTGRFSFVLDGMDQTLAFSGHALVRPEYAGMVTAAIMRTPEGRRLYLARAEVVLNTVLKPIDWDARIDVVGKRVRDALAASHPEQAKAFDASIKLTKGRVAGRIAGVERQIAAASKPTPGK